jgi:hypothetical protein
MVRRMIVALSLLIVSLVATFSAAWAETMDELYPGAVGR